MPVWFKLIAGVLCLNVFILGTGWYSNKQLQEMHDYIHAAEESIDHINESVDKNIVNANSVIQKMDDVNASIKASSKLAEDVYHQPLQSINFARSAQNDFISVDFLFYKAYQQNMLSDKMEDIDDGFELFFENFEIAKERAISEDSKEYITEIESLSAKWQSIKNDIVNQTQGYAALEAISIQMQAALSNLVEFEASAGYDYVLKAEQTTEQALKTSSEMRLSTQRITESTSEIQKGAEVTKQTILAALHDAEKIKTASQSLSIISTICGLLIAGFLAFNILTPLRQALRISAKIAAGDLNNRINSKRRDELGKLLRSFDNMQNDLKKSIATQKEAILNAQAEEQKKRETLLYGLSSELTQDISQITGSINDALGALENVSQGLMSAAKTSRDSSDETFGHINHVSGNVNAIASSTDQLSASISEIAAMTQESTNISQQAAQKAQTATEAVGTLNDAADKIGDIVSLISEIAEKTNLLALNATIESARAGDAGKGFAVVANEVKTLAAQTSSATDDIQRQVDNIQNVAEHCTKVIEEIIGTVKGFNDMALSIDSSMNEQHGATSEISQQVQTTSTSMDQTHNNIQRIAQSNEVVEKSSSEVTSSIKQLMNNMLKMEENIKNISNKIISAA